MKTTSRQNLKEQLLKHTRREGDCLVWLGSSSSGYPVANVRGKKVRVRRLLYEICGKRPLLNGTVVRSTCNRRNCINPDHLIRGKRGKGGNPYPQNSTGNRRYHWDRWFARRFVTLKQDRDYHGLPHSFAQMARNAAHARGLKLSIRIKSAGIVTIEVIGEIEHASSR